MALLTGCVTESDSGSDDEQTTTPVENPSNPSNSDGGNTSSPGTSGSGNSNTTPSTPETPKATYTITFDANGGIGTIASISAEEGSEITLPENTFTRTGHIFAGWNTKNNGTGANHEDKSTIKLTGNITLYAKWTVTVDSVSEAIKNIPADGNVHTVVFTGEISEDIITAIRSALYENSDARINLDISGTTGLTEIPEEAFYEWVLQDVNPCKALAGIVLPEGIESINQEAFETCSNLTDIVIPDSVKTIGALAFSNSGLASIKFGSGLESIGIRAFSECNSLTEITVPGNVKTIEQLTFWNCENLEEVVLEEGVQTIGEDAFCQCEKLTTVTIPKSVISIEYRAFIYTSLQTVKYGGTMAEWKDFVEDTEKVSNLNEYLLNATIHCTDGDITPTTSGN